MSARTEPRRGFTLLELMVAGAVGLVILTAAMAAFDLQSQFARNTERLLGTQASAGLGLTMMQRDLENAGLRFRGGVQMDGGVAYAVVVRPYDNLDPSIALKNDPLGASNITAVAPPAAGFIPGTDAFEVLMGGNVATAQRVAAQVQLVSPGGGPNQLLVRISPNPFIANELTAGGSFAPVLMFWNDDIHCMGRVVPNIAGGPVAQATVQTVDMDLAPSATAWPTNCPKPLMQVEILQQRRRYFVYQTQSWSGPLVNKPARIGLHMQTNPACDPVGTGIQVCTTDFGTTLPSMVAEGVDDMQISWRIFDGFAPAGLPGGVGWCQKSTTDPSCGFELAPALWTPTIVQRAAAIYGAQINLASRGQEIFRRPNEPVPPLLNHTPAVAADGIVRSLMQTSVLFRNSVTP
jgi:prepilin-type N-terminal cleavage/methylation domain-containing protein